MELKAPDLYFLERDDEGLELAALLSQDGHLADAPGWRALAPHLDRAVPLDVQDLSVLNALPPGTSSSRDSLAARFGDHRIARLIELGMLIGDHDDHAPFRDRERTIRATGWWGPALVAHRFGRWQDVDISADHARNGGARLARMIQAQGPPPPECEYREPPETWLALPAPVRTDLDELLARRTTCRNFDPAFSLPLAELATVLRRVFGAQAAKELVPGAVALKKNSPSGGSLHPIEAYLLVQRVAGLAPGLYHYQPVAHALEPLSSRAAGSLAVTAHELVAGQAWFANAPVLILMAARFQRNFWKYRNHAKAWRVIQLDAGHLSQNLYLSATELGYGAFVTGAINDECAERLFELDGLSTGAVVVCGFGRRAETIVTTEFDPLGKAVR